MKVTTNCNACKKNMLKQALEQYGAQQYEIFDETCDTAAHWVLCIALSVLQRKNATPEEIKEFFNDFKFIADTPAVFGKELKMDDTIKNLEKEYDINFNDISLHHEGKKQFITRFMKAQK